MKKVFFIMSVCLLIVLIVTNIIYATDIKVDDKGQLIEPEGVMYCGPSPDGKHHIHMSSVPWDTNIINNSEEIVLTTKGRTGKCEYCGSQYWIDVYAYPLEKYAVEWKASYQTSTITIKDYNYSDVNSREMIIYIQ